MTSLAADPPTMSEQIPGQIPLPLPTVMGIPVGPDEWDFAPGTTCNPNSPEDCEACQ